VPTIDNDFTMCAICACRSAKMANVVSSNSLLAFCSQGATWAKFERSARSKLVNACAVRSPAVPVRAMHAVLPCAVSKAVRKLAAEPSVSSDRCFTGRPNKPPKALISCQAAREPIR